MFRIINNRVYYIMLMYYFDDSSDFRHVLKTCCSLSPQRCCSLSATRWGTSPTYLRTRWPQQAPYRAALPRGPPFKPLKPPKLPKHRPLQPPSRPCHPSLYPSPLPSHRPRPPPQPLCPQGSSSRWHAAHHSSSHGPRWSNRSSLSHSQRPSPPSRYYNIWRFPPLTSLLWRFIFCWQENKS